MLGSTPNGGRLVAMVLAIVIAIALIGVATAWGSTTDADSADVIARRPNLRHVA